MKVKNSIRVRKLQRKLGIFLHRMFEENEKKRKGETDMGESKDKCGC